MKPVSASGGQREESPNHSLVVGSPTTTPGTQEKHDASLPPDDIQIAMEWARLGGD